MESAPITGSLELDTERWVNSRVIMISGGTLNRRCNNILGISHFNQSVFLLAVHCITSFICFWAFHGSAQYGGGAASCFPVSISSSYLPLFGGSAFSLLIMPAPSWQ